MTLSNTDDGTINFTEQVSVGRWSSVYPIQNHQLYPLSSGYPQKCHHNHNKPSLVIND